MDWKRVQHESREKRLPKISEAKKNEVAENEEDHTKMGGLSEARREKRWGRTESKRKGRPILNNSEQWNK